MCIFGIPNAINARKMELVKRFFKPPVSSFFLFGPRGTGKTIFLKQHFPDAIYIDLLQPETYRSFTAKPERLREVIKAGKNNTTVIIDDIQKLPELLPLIQHGAPTQARLHRIEHEKLVVFAVVMHRHAPLGVVVHQHQRVVAQPRAADALIVSGHDRRDS